MVRKNHGPESGTVYVISGTAGGSRTENTFDHPVMVPFNNREGEPRGLEIPGSLLLEVDNQVLHCQQIDQYGLPVDEFRIIKGH